jgi:hypothetical protein
LQLDEGRWQEADGRRNEREEKKVYLWIKSSVKRNICAREAFVTTPQDLNSLIPR